MIKYCYKIINLLREKWEKYGGKYEKIIQKSSGGSMHIGIDITVNPDGTANAVGRYAVQKDYYSE